jgi:hypothetical protein
MPANSAYLKPMLDPGSPRVFNCNVMTHQILAKDPNASQFYRCKPLNGTLLIKDTAIGNDARKTGGSIGTKLYFPFNVDNIYEGGRTIFVHDRLLEKAIVGQYGEGAIAKENLDQDLRVLHILDQLPSLDPFLMKDAFLRQRLNVNNDYFVISAEAWNEIEQFMLQRFEPLVKAAFPENVASDDKARQLINTIWEARDLNALKPLITAFRLPENDALDIFASWKGIVYYAFQYQSQKVQLMDMMKWLKASEAAGAGVPTSERKEMAAMIDLVREQMKNEWQKIEIIVRQYEDAYDKMFKTKTNSADFLAFLKNSNQIYWEIGNSIGKTNQGLYCWKVMTSRFTDGKVGWLQLQEIMGILVKVFEPDKKTVAGVAWQ